MKQKNIYVICPNCGKKLKELPEIYGYYRYHDKYFGCKPCDEIFELKARGSRNVLVSKGSLWLTLKIAARKKDEKRQQAKLLRDKLDNSES